MRVVVCKDSLGDLIDVSTGKRNLDQYQDSGCPDIIIDNLFSVEVKHYKSGRWYKDALAEAVQAICTAAAIIGLNIDSNIGTVDCFNLRYDRMDASRQQILNPTICYVCGRGLSRCFEDRGKLPDGRQSTDLLTMEFDTCLMLMREWL